MKNLTRREFVALAFGALAAIAAPKTAEAAEPRENWPEAMQEDPTTEQNGILYLLHDDSAIVIETPDRRAVTIPDSIKHDGNKSDTVQAGQAQDALTTGKIRAFWKKWDAHHLKQLTDEERRELAHDLEGLKQVYNHIQFTADKAPHEPTPSERRALSMQEISRNAAKEA